MRILILSMVVLLSGCSGLHAAPPAQNKHAKKVPDTTAVGVEVVFSESEIRTIRAYYESHESNHAAGKGKGKHKHKGLPPGIAKNLARGKPLPPGIAKRSLPYELSRQLPPPRSGYEIIVVAGKVLLIEVATQIVRDVLTDALFS